MAVVLRGSIVFLAATIAHGLPVAEQEHCLFARSSLLRLREDVSSVAGVSYGSDETCSDYMQTVGCEWTRRWNCPNQTGDYWPGGQGAASDDNSLGYTCCCGQELWRTLSDPCDEYMSKAACDWTSQWNCPGQTGGDGAASDDHSLGYSCCCNREGWKGNVTQPTDVLTKVSVVDSDGEITTCTYDDAAGVCMLWGDPHIYVFDGKRHVRILENGDFWIVRSSNVSIQARYANGGPDGKSPSVIGALAVGGPFLEGHVLVIEVTDGVKWDGQSILTEFPSTFNIAGLIQASFNGDSEHVDPGLRGIAVRSLSAVLPLGMELTVNRWSDHLDVLLSMHPLAGGQDGHCGNFNGDASDDSTEQIMSRMGAQVLDEQSLLPPASGEPKSVPRQPQLVPTLEDCREVTLHRAQEQCEDDAPVDLFGDAAAEWLQACMLDVCFGGERFAREDAVIEEQMASRANASLSAKCGACSPASTHASTHANTHAGTGERDPTPSPTQAPTPAPTPK